MDKTYSLYVHTNNINGKKYVGITSQGECTRWKNGHGYKGQVLGYKIKKYGWKNFSHEVIKTHLTELEARELESEYIRNLNTCNPNYGYNMTYKGIAEKKDTVKATIEVESDLYKRFKAKTVINGTKVVDIVTKAMKDYLGEQE